MDVDPVAQPDELYRTLTSLVIPRPIGWISTVDESGAINLAPYSYFNAVSSRPPVVLFSANERDGEMKDSSRNALDTGEFVVNLVTEDLLSAMDTTSTSADVDEFEAAGLDRSPSRTVAPPRVAAAKAHLECRVRETVQLGTHTVVFGDVTHISVDDSLLTNGAVDTLKVDAVGRLGGPYYTGINVLDFERQY